MRELELWENQVHEKDIAELVELQQEHHWLLEEYCEPSFKGHGSKHRIRSDDHKSDEEGPDLLINSMKKKQPPNKKKQKSCITSWSERQ